MYCNNRVNLSEFIKCNEKELGIEHQVYYPALQELLKEYKTKEERMTRNFGCPIPEGYRTALRLMQQAEK